MQSKGGDYLFIIDARSSTPIYEQIIHSVKESIIKGILQPGDKLPSVRELASMLTTNPNTVSKAYSELERMKIIETLRGRGTFVSTDYKPKLEEEKMAKLKEDLKKVLMDAHYMGIKKGDIKNIMEELYSELLGESKGGRIDE
jgi:GntR family transcriptional regulator